MARYATKLTFRTEFKGGYRIAEIFKDECHSGFALCWRGYLNDGKMNGHGWINFPAKKGAIEFLGKNAVLIREEKIRKHTYGKE